MKSLALLVAMGFAFSSAQAADQVSGTFTVKGKPAPLHYIYAFWRPSLMKQGTFDLFVLLSDVPIPNDTLPWDDDGFGKMAALVRDDKIHAFEVHFDGASSDLFGGEQGGLYDLAIAPAHQGAVGMVHFQPDKTSPGIRAGKLSVDDDTEKTLGWKIEATFSVAIPPQPPAKP